MKTKSRKTSAGQVSQKKLKNYLRHRTHAHNAKWLWFRWYRGNCSLYFAMLVNAKGGVVLSGKRRLKRGWFQLWASAEKCWGKIFQPDTDTPIDHFMTWKTKKNKSPGASIGLKRLITKCILLHKTNKSRQHTTPKKIAFSTKGGNTTVKENSSHKARREKSKQKRPAWFWRWANCYRW